jgi:hypothetical protein
MPAVEERNGRAQGELVVLQSCSKWNRSQIPKGSVDSV